MFLKELMHWVVEYILWLTLEYLSIVNANFFLVFTIFFHNQARIGICFFGRPSVSSPYFWTPLAEVDRWNFVCSFLTMFWLFFKKWFSTIFGLIRWQKNIRNLVFFVYILKPLKWDCEIIKITNFVGIFFRNL